MTMLQCRWRKIRTISIVDWGGWLPPRDLIAITPWYYPQIIILLHNLPVRWLFVPWYRPNNLPATPKSKTTIPLRHTLLHLYTPPMITNMIITVRNIHHPPPCRPKPTHPPRDIVINVIIITICTTIIIICVVSVLITLSTTTQTATSQHTTKIQVVVSTRFFIVVSYRLRLLLFLLQLYCLDPGITQQERR